MNDEIVSVVKEFLGDRSKFHFLNYYYYKMLDETCDYDEYGYNLECLYEWQSLTEVEWDLQSDFFRNDSDSDRNDWIEEELLIGFYSDTSSEHYNPDSDPEN